MSEQARARANEIVSRHLDAGERWPRLVEAVAAEQDHCFYHGFALALANANRLFDCPTIVSSTLHGAGITIETLHEHGVEEYDLAEIRKCLKQAGQ